MLEMIYFISVVAASQPCGNVKRWDGCMRKRDAGVCYIEIRKGLPSWRKAWTIMHEKVHCQGYEHGEDFDRAMRLMHSPPPEEYKFNPISKKLPQEVNW